ncbi:hypothetical protein J7443_15060 [Tropicibacter sp. R15_0]|uniref:hypothetical protein n=1 Tax=Tropicibacter sp. R15_0 TaxID=2821101 RepID=UPI001ADB227A|nr:hypothetical protein [Tropicibacter sp. R15_0]
MPDGRFQHLPKRYNFLVHCGFGWWLEVRIIVSPKNPIILQGPSGNLRKPHLAKIGNQMVFEARLVATQIDLVPLALGHDFILFHKPLCGLRKRLLRQQFSSGFFRAQFQVPVLSNLLGAWQA